MDGSTEAHTQPRPKDGRCGRRLKKNNNQEDKARATGLNKNATNMSNSWKSHVIPSPGFIHEFPLSLDPRIDELDPI